MAELPPRQPPARPYDQLVVGWRLLKLYAFGRKNRFNKYVSRHIRAFLIGEVNAPEED